MGVLQLFVSTTWALKLINFYHSAIIVKRMGEIGHNVLDELQIPMSARRYGHDTPSLCV